MTPESDQLTEPRKVVEDTNAMFLWNRFAIAKFFQFHQHQAKLSTEILAGVTTFVTMAYILVVNPDILSNAIFIQQPKDLFGELVIATGISAALAAVRDCETNFYVSIQLSA